MRDPHYKDRLQKVRENDAKHEEAMLAFFGGDRIALAKARAQFVLCDKDRAFMQQEIKNKSGVL